MNRRGFLSSILALGAAPAVVRAASLMKVVTPSGVVAPSYGIPIPVLYGQNRVFGELQSEFCLPRELVRVLEKEYMRDGSVQIRAENGPLIYTFNVPFHDGLIVEPRDYISIQREGK